MSKIVAKLNLNKTPQLVENNSLVMAKNIRLLDDGTIGPDTSLEEIQTVIGNATQVLVHHDAVTEEITDYEFTILEPYTILDIEVNQFQLDEQYLQEYACDELNRVFYRCSYLNTYEIEHYHIYNEHINYETSIFRYDPNENILINNSGFCLFLAIRSDVYDDPSLAYPEEGYYYVALPKINLGETVRIEKRNYVIVNPLYATTENKTIIISNAYDELITNYDTAKYIGQIVGLDNKIYFFREDLSLVYSPNIISTITTYYPNESFITQEERSGTQYTLGVNEYGYVTRMGVLLENRELAEEITPNFYDRVKIFEYDEISNTFTIVRCNWRYSGGKINGCVTVNNTGEYILTICEYDVPFDKLVPIKHINLNKCSFNDDESTYTQAPNIPISNLILVNKYIKNIPSGTYQFFIRYKIHDKFYTNWFPCSKELFAGNRKRIDTLQGSIKYTDLHEDSNQSFVFRIDHLFPTYCLQFEQFQLGFIISSDGGVFARTWKHFDFNSDNNLEDIYFEYNNEDIEEANIDDFLKVTYDVFNVENIVSYKNKLYISNYQETDFNEDLQDYAKQVNVELRSADIFVESGYAFYFDGMPLIESQYQDIYDKYGNQSIKHTFASNNYCNRGELEIYHSNHITVVTTLNITNGEVYNPNDYLPFISKIYIKYNNQNYYIAGTDNSYANITITELSENLIMMFALHYVRDTIVGITSDGIYKARINNENIDAVNICVEYKYYTQSEAYQEENLPDWYIDVEEHFNTIDQTINLKDGIISTNFEFNYKEYNTLLPFTKYDFYIHYVKQNGVSTNGYFIGTKEITRYCIGCEEINNYNNEDVTEINSIDKLNDLCFYKPEFEDYLSYTDSNNNTSYYKINEDISGHHIIYPYFSNIKCPSGYVSCFISISKHGSNAVELFNYQTGIKKKQHIFDCIELDCLLYNQLNNIEIRDSRGRLLTAKANYYSSSSTSVESGSISPVKLGCSGHVEFFTTETLNIDSKCWIIFNSVNKPYNKTLTKVTPYLKLATTAISYDNFEDVNTLGYYCEVMKLDREYCDAKHFDNGNYADNDHGYYVSGTDIYTRSSSGNDIDINPVILKVNYHSSNVYYIHSNFNLNYLSLTQDLAPTIRRYNVATTTNNNVTTETSNNQIITLVDSLICSFILELKSMYKDYTKKYYYEYSKNKVIKFNNTVRCSNVDVDEVYRYIYRFDATDYYNVPTKRGIITNLVSIANSVYVHCEHSLFKFSDNKTITAQEEEVTLQENDIFNSGITELFDAQYGFAGLKTREQSLVTYNAYIFYDDVTKTIYSFEGEQQISIVSNSIKKLIEAINPIDVRFVADEQHNRYFVNLKNNNGNVCLSYSFTNKAFISIHDIEFKFGFHSRRHTYFVTNIVDNDIVMGWALYRITNKIVTDVITPYTHSHKDNYIAYQACYKRSLVWVPDCDDNIPFNSIKSANACVDIIVNTEYETIKVIDYINWICSEIERYGNSNNLTSEEQLNRKYPGNKIKIFSDSTSTSLIVLDNNVDNPHIANYNRNIDANGDLKPNPKNWQYPNYNCGIWSMNYFRDVQNIVDWFVYRASSNEITGGTGHSETTDLTPKVQREYFTQESSLIYGKYFIVRFIFNNRNFKLENIKLKMSDYEKTK